MSPAAASSLSSSSRWCPTPEQLMILEEMYRSAGGIRTPNALEIQQITAHLSFYGRIEGKNVFYWFQNHKARDKQRLRRKLIIKQMQMQHHGHQLSCNYHSHAHLDFHFLQMHPHHHASLPPTHHHQYHHHHHHHTPAASAAPLPPQEKTKYTWKADVQDTWEMENSTMRECGPDLRSMDVGPTSPCSNRPLKTLQLFPTTSTSLKDE